MFWLQVISLGPAVMVLSFAFVNQGFKNNKSNIWLLQLLTPAIFIYRFVLYLGQRRGAITLLFMLWLASLSSTVFMGNSILRIDSYNLYKCKKSWKIRLMNS